MNPLALLPIRDWLYVGAIVSLLIAFGIYTHHERSVGAAREVAAYTAASQKAEAAAEKRITTLNTQHAAEVAAVEEKLSEANKANDALAARDAQRLREFAAYRQSHARVAGAPAVAAAPAAGANGPQQGSDSLTSLGNVAQQLADAARYLDSALTACQNDRQSLVGK